VPVDRHPLPFLPALNGRHVALEIRGNFLPGIQPVFGCFARWVCARWRLVNRLLLLLCGPS
jgi:hypothetical protein